LKVLEPKQFQANDAWLAFKLNDAPVCTEADGDFNVIALMDAASCFILGMEMISVDSAEPTQLDSKRLIQSAYAHKNKLARKLFIPTQQKADHLAAEAAQQGMSVVRTPEDDLQLFIREAREGFREHVGGPRSH
jgi:hypothetical protein